MAQGAGVGSRGAVGFCRHSSADGAGCRPDFVRLGARHVTVPGDLKFAAEPLPADPAELAQLQSGLLPARVACGQHASRRGKPGPPCASGIGPASPRPAHHHHPETSPAGRQRASRRRGYGSRRHEKRRRASA